MTGKLIWIKLENFRALVSFEATPNGRSFDLVGANECGKSSCIDGLAWALGMNFDAEVISNGKDEVTGSVIIGEYEVTRKKKRGKEPRLVVRKVGGRVPEKSPTALLAGFHGALERRTFSRQSGREQVAILKQLCPLIDTTALDAEHDSAYDRRTKQNTTAKEKRAAAKELKFRDDLPDEPVNSKALMVEMQQGAEANAKTEKLKAAKERAALDAKDRDEKADDLMAGEADRLKSIESRGDAEIAELTKKIERIKKGIVNEQIALREENTIRHAKLLKEAAEFQKASEAAISDLVDTAAILAKMADANVTNAEIEKREQAKKLFAEARAAEAKSDELTQRMDEIKEEKATQIANAKLPVPGLAVSGETVTLLQRDGPVEISALNTAERMRLDVVIAAALGHHLVSVPDASLLDDDSRAELADFARSHDVQLISERVVTGEPLSVEIIEEGNDNA